MAASRPAFAESIAPAMRICRSLSADFCLGRAVRAQASSGRQNSPVRVSSEHPADDCNSLIPRMFAALRSARLRFLPCFPLKNRGETDATEVLAPLFARERTCHQQHDADEARLCDERGEGDGAAPLARVANSGFRARDRSDSRPRFEDSTIAPCGVPPHSPSDRASAIVRPNPAPKDG
jgi:hypothetical protein